MCPNITHVLNLTFSTLVSYLQVAVGASASDVPLTQFKFD